MDSNEARQIIQAAIDLKTPGEPETPPADPGMTRGEFLASILGEHGAPEQDTITVKRLQLVELLKILEDK